jgi:predicted membrane-bound spermidine synthase
MRVHVPSFGEWAVTLAGHHAFPWSRTRVRVKTRFLTDRVYPTLFVFPADLKPVDVTISTLDNPTVVHEYLKDWREYFK